MLKSNAKSGFVWDDVKGMGVTQEKRTAWDKLVEVCAYFKSVDNDYSYYYYY
jgi:hypothetical protein